MNVSAISRKLISGVMRLQRKIEETAVNTPTPGFAMNQFGSYDSERLREKLLAEYASLVAGHPEESYFQYLYAGALSRACEFSKAVTLYKALMEHDGPYREPSGMMLTVSLWLAGNHIAAQEALDTHNASLVAKGGTPRHTRAEQLFAPGAAL